MTEAPYRKIPGTVIFDSEMARKGYHLNQFCMSLAKEGNRGLFKANEASYLAAWPMTEEQRQAVRARDYNRLLSLGGNIYFLAKLFSTDGLSFAQACAGMSGMSVDDYQAMMLAGGRAAEADRGDR
jgi:protocatechuate 4,5-dioxygenase, alpha chain